MSKSMGDLSRERDEAVERVALLEEQLADLRFDRETDAWELRKLLNDALHEDQRSKDAPLKILVGRLIRQYNG